MVDGGCGALFVCLYVCMNVCMYMRSRFAFETLMFRFFLYNGGTRGGGGGGGGMVLALLRRSRCGMCVCFGWGAWVGLVWLWLRWVCGR